MENVVFDFIAERKWCHDNVKMLKENYLGKYIAVSNRKIHVSADSTEGAIKKAEEMGLKKFLVVGVCTPKKPPEIAERI